MDELPTLMALRVQGISPADRAAVASGTDPDEAAAALALFVSRGLATQRGARGFSLTPKGAEALDELLADEGLETSTVLHECYERFLGLNQRVLKVSSDWQLRREGGVDVPNDHSDTHYDEDVIERLAQIHDRA